MNERNERVGAKAGQFAVEMVTLENGGIVKSIHGGLYTNSIWYSVYGSKGHMESSREITDQDRMDRILVDADEHSGDYAELPVDNYRPADREPANNNTFGHGGSDFYTMHYFIEKIRGNENAEVIDVYEALDMYLPGLLGYRSVLNGSKSVAIPNLRNKAERDQWRNDTACTIPAAAGDSLLPTRLGGTPELPDEVYDKVRDQWKKNIGQ